MAIVTDSIVDVGSYTTFNIGLSKAISNYTADEVWNFPYCSSSWDAFRHVFDESYQGIAPGTLEASEYQMPFHFTGVNQMYVPATYNFEEGQIEYNQGDLGIYGKIIWLCETGDTSISHIFGTQRYIKNTDGVKIITQMDMTQVYLFLDTFQNPASNDPMYANYDNFKIKENHEGITTYEHPRNCSIFPAVMFQYNSKLYIHRIFQDTYTNLDWSWWLSYYGDSDHGGHTEQQGHHFNAQPVSFDGTKEAYFAINIMRQFSGLRPTSTERFYTGSDIEDVGARYQWMYGYDGGRICPATEAKYLQMISWYGGMFYHNGTYYKPIIEDGYVTGYTDDMTVPSDIDNWVGATNHDVPPAPPGHDTTDDIDDHVMGSGTGISGMANLWLLTRSQLNDLHGAFNTAPGGFDPMNSLISVMGLGVSPTYLFDNIEVITPINIRKSDGTSWSTGVEGHIVDAQKSAFQFTGIKIDRLYNNFLDYSPYAIHEIFIPMCGWITLPDIAVDRKITVTYLPDIESLKCRAVVSVVDNSGNRCVIGEKDGIMGADVPFTNTGHSLYVGEAIINGMNVAGEVITGAIGAGFTKQNAKGGTYRPYEGFTVGMGGTLPGAIGNAIVSGQTNRTHYMTGNGTRIGFSDGENIQIKSTYHNIDRPANYAHTVGLVCNMTNTLDKFSGFTVCDNPHITFSALEAEKSEIKALLEEGVIL